MGRPRSDACQAARAADIRSLRVTNKLRYAKWWADDVDTILGRYSAAACGERVAEAASEKFLLDRLERQWEKTSEKIRALERQWEWEETCARESVQGSQSGAALLAISRFLKLASPDAAEGMLIDEVLLSLHSEVDAALNTGNSLVDVPAGHALAQFLASARAAVANKQKHHHMYMQEEAISNIQLVILPAHVDAFTKKLEEFSSNGRPCVPCVAFHSTPHEDAWRGIARDNFDPEKCGRHDPGFYGRGTYFHTNVPYGGCCGGSKTFLSLILKGVEYELNYRLGCPLEKGFDSHIAADRKNTGETVIFHQSQMIPVISYDWGLASNSDSDAYSDYDYDSDYDSFEYDYREAITTASSTLPFFGDYDGFEHDGFEYDYWQTGTDYIWGPCSVCSSCYCNDCHCLTQAFDSRWTRCREARRSWPRRAVISSTPAPGVNDRLHETAPDMKLAYRSWQRRSRRRAARSRAVRRASERHSE
jgi:hypothetical protein